MSSPEELAREKIDKILNKCRRVVQGHGSKAGSREEKGFRVDKRDRDRH